MPYLTLFRQKPATLVLALTRICPFDTQVTEVLQSCFAQLKQLTKIRSFLSLEKVIHAFISSRLGCCNTLHCGISRKCCCQVFLILTKREATTLHQSLPVSLRTDLRILFLVFKALNVLSPAYIRDLLTPNEHDDDNLPKNHFFYTNFLLLLCSLSGFLHCYCYALNILWDNDEICDVNQPQPTRSPWCNNRWVQTLRFFMLTCVFYVVLFNHKNTRLATGNHYFFAFEFQVFTRYLNSIQ